MHVSRLVARSIEALRREADPSRNAETHNQARRRKDGRKTTRGSSVAQVMDFDINVEERGDLAVVAVSGELDISTSPLLRDRLVELGSGKATKLVIDLEAVEFLDSTGLGVLVGGLKRMRSKDGDLVLVCTKPRILKVFEITALTNVFKIAASRDEALTED
jgi:anti-sigma B factor antagonist